MAKPSDDARLKIVWAQKHLDIVKLEVKRYIHSGAYRVTTNLKGKGREYVPIVKTQPSTDISLAIGDCVCSAMASLDYIVWGLAGLYAGRPLVPPPVGHDAPSFPLFVDPVKFKKTERPGGFKIPAAVLSIIEQVQPYNAGYEPLGCLYLLVNQDKHRLPLLTVGCVAATTIDIDYGGGHFTTSIGFGSNAAKTHPDSPFTPATQPEPVNVQVEVAGFVAFDDPAMPRESVVVTLQKIVTTIRDSVIPKFDPVFT